MSAPQRSSPRIRLGVLGWPVAHSRSPSMHNEALRRLGLTGWRYQLLPVPPGLLGQTVRALPAAGFRGANVTVPHKEQALGLAHTLTDRARSIGAVNTLVFEGEDRIHGDNTDGPALLESLPVSPAGATALVLGAGGSARAALWALRAAGAAEVRVWNRSPDRAATLAAEFGAVAVERADRADLLIHCTSSGLQRSGEMWQGLPIQPDDLSAYRCVVDFVYGATPTPLIAEARARAIPAVDGLTLLVGQGALSFRQFTGESPPVEAMRAAAQAR